MFIIFYSSAAAFNFGQNEDEIFLMQEAGSIIKWQAYNEVKEESFTMLAFSAATVWFGRKKLVVKTFCETHET